MRCFAGLQPAWLRPFHRVGNVPAFCRLKIGDTTQRGRAASKLFGVRREAKRHAALAAWVGVAKAVSPLRSATAVQNRCRRRGCQAILIDQKPALREPVHDSWKVRGTKLCFSCPCLLWEVDREIKRIHCHRFPRQVLFRCANAVLQTIDLDISRVKLFLF